MKKLMALTTATLTLAGALALTACSSGGKRADQRTNNPVTTVQQQPAPAANQPGASQLDPANPAPADPVKADADLSDVSSQLSDVDADLAAAAQAPEDSD